MEVNSRAGEPRLAPTAFRLFWQYHSKRSHYHYFIGVTETYYYSQLLHSRQTTKPRRRACVGATLCVARKSTITTTGDSQNRPYSRFETFVFCVFVVKFLCVLCVSVVIFVFVSF